MNSNVWWVVRNLTVVTGISAGGAWAIMWVFDPSPNLWVVFGWAVSIALVSVWFDAATLNRRRADLESSVLRAGHRNRRPR